MSDKRENTCETCKWMDSLTLTGVHKTSDIGYTYTVRAPDHICRRHGPITFNEFGMTRMQWPPVDMRDWCGEWEQREGVSHG